MTAPALKEYHAASDQWSHRAAETSNRIASLLSLNKPKRSRSWQKLQDRRDAAKILARRS